jgi:hypothetical protein
LKPAVTRRRQRVPVVDEGRAVADEDGVADPDTSQTKVWLWALQKRANLGAALNLDERAIPSPSELIRPAGALARLRPDTWHQVAELDRGRNSEKTRVATLGRDLDGARMVDGG